MHPMLLHERYLTDLAINEIGSDPLAAGQVQQVVNRVCHRFPSLANPIALQLHSLRHEQFGEELDPIESA